MKKFPFISAHNTASQLLKLLFFALSFNFLLFNINSAQAESKQSPKITFTLIANEKDEQSYTAKIKLENLPYAGKWQLGFTSVNPITSLDHAEIVMPKQVGGFYLISFQVPQGNNSATFDVKGKGSVKKYTEAPLAYFLVANPDSAHPTVLPLKNATTQLLPPQLAVGDNEGNNKQKNNTSIEGNPTKTTLTTDTSLIVPLPVELRRYSGQFVLNKKTRVLVADSDARGAVNFFRSVVQSATGYKLNVSEYQSDGQPLRNAILLTSDNAETLLQGNQREEGYVLEVTPESVVIHALSTHGFFYAMQSLRELLPPEIFTKIKPSHPREWKIPSVYIKDYPRFRYRGLQLDVARHFVSVDQVKRLIDLMAMHKLNYFEWHLTDDEGWRIEIKKYPQLTTKGAWRGYNPKKHDSKYDLFPALGSSATTYGGYYTQEEIRAVVKYAQERHVTVVPEINLLGHARAMIMSLPTELIDTADHSVYTSIQGYHDNFLSPCKASTFTVIDNIMTEIARLFPGKYIHVGGDEIPQGVWQKSCMSKKYSLKDPEFTNKVQNDFLKKVQGIITNQGKVMAGWEEIINTDGTLTTPLLVYVWNMAKMDQVYKKSAQQGYQIIMAPAKNLDFDLAYTADPKEPGEDWAGYVDTFSAYAFKPIDQGKGQSDAIIKGVQAQLWSEFIDSAERLDYLAFPKIAGLSELAWTPAERRNWKNFSDRMRYLHMLRLQYYGVGYRKMEFPAIKH